MLLTLTPNAQAEDSLSSCVFESIKYAEFLDTQCKIFPIPCFLTETPSAEYQLKSSQSLHKLDFS